MHRSQFEGLVRQAVGGIPDEIRRYLDNVDVVVEGAVAQEQLAGHVMEDDQLLLGLYEGVPLTERDNYGMVLPDKITLFQDAIESVCDTDEQIVDEVRTTVVHELAHHFGIEDDRLDELGV
jgi:predicted Zn-dependent protease with MMP-like domain